ncbi:hypothetical protein PENTCL1PPCAC_11260, partial [Pristionchus entomophagus]
LPLFLSIIILGMDLGGEAVVLIQAIDEFYSTTDQSRRLALNEYLCNFKNNWDCHVTIQGCFLLLSRHNSPNVQYFGALSLYDTIKHRWEDILDKPELLGTLKSFLINALTEGASVQSQSLTNKLSSSLALLALYCIPDVWNSPVQDLTTLWAATPELLLRVLAELAAEFPNVHMPLTQRSILKTELHRVSEDMIKILTTVLQSAADSAPSLLNAAVECVEQWLRLPGSNLKQWTPLLSHVFGAVCDDSTALTNLLTILGANDELVNEEQLVHDVLQYVCGTLAQKVMGELSRDALSEEMTALAAATCSLSERVVPVLVRSSMRGSTQLVEELTSFFASLSSIPGRYPMDEAVSEIPHIFFSSLREEVCSAKTEDRDKLMSALRSPFEKVLVGAVNKLMYAPNEVREEMNEEEKESFENYRSNRMECGVNSFLMLGQSALVYLNGRCYGASEETGGDKESAINLMESCLYNWEQIADYLGEENQTEIVNLVQVTSKMFTSGASSVEEWRIANTLMRLIFAISHLVSGHEQATSLELECIQMVLNQLEVKAVTGEALNTLIKLIEDRPEWLKERGYSDDLIARCSSLFQNESLPQKHRLAALKAIGISLSLREPTEIMEILRAPLELYLAGVEGQTTNAGDEVRKKFQIGIFSTLFSSLHTKSRPDAEAVVLLLRLANPLLVGILERNPTPIIAERALDALRNACITIPSSRISEFFLPLKKAVGLSLTIHPNAACNLAKTLVFSAASVLKGEMGETVEEWVGIFEMNYPSEGVEEWIGLMTQILKKEWKLLDAPERALNIISSAVNLSTQALSSSEDPNVVKCSSQLLATIVSNVLSRGHELGRKILEQKILLIVQIVFRRIQIELMRQTIESLADVLFFFMQAFTTETRNVLNGEENGTTPMVSALFREIGNQRNFKTMTLRLNMAARKDCA